ncbi:hypothetical protein UlMin_033319 [Ulmus minor]
MEALRVSPIFNPLSITTRNVRIQSKILISSNFNPISSSYFSSENPKDISKFKLSSSTNDLSPPQVLSVSNTELINGSVLENPTREKPEAQSENNKFDWYSEWYPIMPVCDLDKKEPHGKKVMGLEVVVWWDRNENAWKVFEDKCPHRLAPLSGGRIDDQGRLQCIYHGWCFNGKGNCKFIPQASSKGPPIHTFKRACAGVYPSTVSNGIVWFYPNSDPKSEDIVMEKKPPLIPELDDPSFTNYLGVREINYGYEVLIENFTDPAHIPYAHFGLLQAPQPEVKQDIEGGMPLDLSIKRLDANGFLGKQEPGTIHRFFAPCVFYSSIPLGPPTEDPWEQRRLLLVFICIPVGPGKSRVIWSFPRNVAIWVDKFVPRWMYHITENLIFDSDLFVLHKEERNILEAGGSSQWNKSCFVPTKSDALVVGFRKWLNKFAGGQVDWRGKFNNAVLPPTPERDQLMDRYWSHVMNCKSCKAAHEGLKVFEVVLQVMSIALVGIVAATKQHITSIAAKTAMVSLAILCFAASKWLAKYVYKVFHYHDYNHALR